MDPSERDAQIIFTASVNYLDIIAGTNIYLKMFRIPLRLYFCLWSVTYAAVAGGHALKI